MAGRVAVLLILAMFPAAAPAQIQGLPYEPPAVRLLPPIPADAPSVYEPIEIIGSTPIGLSPPPNGCPRNPFACNNDPFRNLTPGGLAITCFPQSLLWEPPLASRMEPRFTLVPTSLRNEYTGSTLDLNLGATAGLTRFDREGEPLRMQLDFFGVVASRISHYDYLVASDYRAGLPLTFELGPWHGKAAYEHTSTHIGDETLLRTGRQRLEYTKDEIVLGLGRWCMSDRLRLYGDAGWAFFEHITGDPSPFRFALGGEWRPRFATGFRGLPFAAANVEFNGANDFSPSLAVQAGWLWRAPERRLGQFRAYIEFFSGHSSYGQFFPMTESFVGVGVALDN